MATGPGVLGVLRALLPLLLCPGLGLGIRGPHHPRGEVLHHHYQPDPQQRTKITQDTRLLQDKDHIREDLGPWVSEDAVNAMTPEELQFHYFKIHDLDNNTKLDGLEILGALIHTSHHDHEEELGENNELGENEENIEKDSLEYFIELTDEVLREDDQDNDGFLSYTEYTLGRQQNQKLASTIMNARK